MSLDAKIRSYTTQLKQKGLLRTRELIPQEAALRFDSNDYLSLGQEQQIKDAYSQGYQHFPSGSAASMLLSGYHPNHQELEAAFAALLHVDSCVLFSSGYAANLAVTALLGRLQAHCLIDKGVHASIYDGLSLAQVSYTRYIHNDLKDFAKKLMHDEPPSLVLTEGIFSMSGQSAPLAEMASLCAPRQLPLIIDEAHSFGVLGEQGAGATSLHQLTQKEVPLRVIPLGKSCVGQGAIVAGQHEWILALLQAGRSLIYSTAVSPALSYGLRKTLDFVIQADERRATLRQLINFFREQIKNSCLNWADSYSMIQQLRLGCPYQAMYYAHELRKQGIYCSVIRSPTVSLKHTGLRIIINYRHHPEQIRQLFQQLHVIHEYSSI